MVTVYGIRKGVTFEQRFCYNYENMLKIQDLIRALMDEQFLVEVQHERI